MIAVCNKSDYLLTLERKNKDIAVHYKDKIRVIQCMDSFTFTSEEMNSSIECFPPVTAFDTSSYLVLTHSFYTNQQMKAYKSLTGYKYFEAGFVHDCEAKLIGAHCCDCQGQAFTEDEQSPTASLDYIREIWCNNFSSLYLHGRPF
ncbi:uncharacterized protein [Leptinotarsa decemlineata]|uniref:uncharacterized protein n=1 Tax=Leptinotarsa decemlineata TaxID=7539 RepID=UPI003D304BE0